VAKRKADNRHHMPVMPDYLRDWAKRVREEAVDGKLSADDAVGLAVDWIDAPCGTLTDYADGSGIDADELAAILADLPTSDVEAHARAMARAFTPDMRAAFMAEFAR
jgi:hypothetical protein